jgi:hypothetical protein
MSARVSSSVNNSTAIAAALFVYESVLRRPIDMGRAKALKYIRRQLSAQKRTLDSAAVDSRRDACATDGTLAAKSRLAHVPDARCDDVEICVRKGLGAARISRNEAISIGFTKWRSNPASVVRRRSSSCPQPVVATRAISTATAFAGFSITRKCVRHFKNPPFLRPCGQNRSHALIAKRTADEIAGQN